MANPGYNFKYTKPAVNIQCQSSFAAQVPLRIKLVSGQTGAALEIKNSSGTTIGGFSAAGLVTATGLTGTGAVDLSAATVTLPENQLLVATATIAAADIVSTSAGKLGHASGYPIVVSPGATKVIEFVSGVIIYDFGVAAYTDGGNVTFNYSGGGAAISGAVSAANSIGSATDEIALVIAVAPTNNILTPDAGINLVAATAFTDPGTAVGVVRIKVTYRVHTHGL